jgi:primosomal protein N' (replication factor Y)
MLVPEIALTPQLEGRVAARFPAAHVVCANSGMADAARARGFLEALAGRADIVLGTRLAVFMPLPRLQLIVVDEEHDASFKQQEGLRYSARDVAIWRAHQREHPHRARFGHALAGDLPSRAARALSQCWSCPSAPWPTPCRRCACVDTRREKLQEGLSAALLAACSCASNAASKAWSSSTGAAMRRCWPARPAAGSRAAALRGQPGAAPGRPRLRCHHCGFETAGPARLPDCGNVDLLPFGRGTQRLEAMLGRALPRRPACCASTATSASTPKKWQALLATIHAGEADILVGTQMLAKGHDFPLLTLVGAVGADAALFAADFRAPERLFAQLMQVGGRSGRAACPAKC